MDLNQGFKPRNQQNGAIGQSFITSTELGKIQLVVDVRVKRGKAEGESGGQFDCAAEIASEMDFRKDSQRHFLRCKISARLLMGNSIAPLSFHLRWIFSKGAKSLDMSQNSAKFSARFSAAQSNCAPGY